jgi:hypothetical protein
LIPTPQNMAQRASILERCKTDRAFRNEVLAQCRVDFDMSLMERVERIVFFTNTFLWTTDPRDIKRGTRPFFLAGDYEVQIDKVIIPLERALAEGDDHWWEKSRAVGFTWDVLAWAFHGWLFRSGWQGLLGSYEEALVDNRTAFSHFGKIDFFFDWLPGWFIPEVVPGWNKKLCRQKLKLVNPNTRDHTRRGNILQGDSSAENFGRGGRFLWLWYDEAASWPDLAGVFASSSQTARSRFGGSTPKGMNYWGQWVHNELVKPKLTRFHWRDCPWLDEEWYKKECARLVDPVLIAQELDISYTGSVEGRVYAAWDDCKFGEYPYEPDWSLYVSWDFGLDGTAIIWWQRDPVTGTVRALDCYQNKNKSIDFYLPFVTGALPGVGEDGEPKHEYTAVELAKITIHASWGQAIHFGDPSVNSRNVASGTSPMDVFTGAGIYVHTNDGANDFQSRRQFTLLGLHGLEVNCPDEAGPIGCWVLSEAMQNSRYPRTKGDQERTVTTRLPVHDRFSHLRTALEYFFANLPPHRGPSRPKQKKQKRRGWDRLIR